MEHLAEIDVFIAEVRRILKKDGLFFAAVPAITTSATLEDNLRNAYHLTNLTPASWYRKISRSFAKVRVFRHWARHPSGDWNAFREADFIIEECDIAAANATPHISNVVFVASDPRCSVQPPQIDESHFAVLPNNVRHLQETIDEAQKQMRWATR